MAIVTDNLIFYYNSKQGATSTTWDDLSGSGRNVTSIIGSTLQTDSYLFDGVDDYMVFPSVPAMTSYTFEAWINYNKASTIYVLSFGSEANGFQIEHSGFSSIRISHNAQSRSGSTSTQNVLGTMAYLAVSYDATTKTARRWINNEELSPLEFLADMVTNSASVVFAKRNTSSTSSVFGGQLASIRMYDRALTPSEIAQNRDVGVEIGLGGPIYPKVTITGHTLSKISRQSGFDRSVISFSFDNDTVEYRANVLGSSWDTGTLAHTFTGNVAAGIVVDAEIDWSELYAEGDNRVNIYGKSSTGHWTNYNSS